MKSPPANSALSSSSKNPSSSEHVAAVDAPVTPVIDAIDPADKSHNFDSSDEFEPEAMPAAARESLRSSNALIKDSLQAAGFTEKGIQAVTDKRFAIDATITIVGQYCCMSALIR